ncbi:MAG TPA: HIT family protein [Flavobacteriales bacterium]|mgnify:CR=1 FL=1|nr:HIT family protein [Flavobacteriales bacterium]HRE74931.1 HIT family protein [Flavobacteriales bacterium]HRE95450.1 HIT family protein [Flavobacteriales bacterium]HRJ39491.1 HIT family protein [Flavobacteriales bacterium]
MSSVFSKIIAGEIPCHKIAENDHFIAFLDVSPLVRGHVLVVPKKETDYIFDLSGEELSEILVFAKGVAAKIRKAIPCERIGVSVIGLEVPHAHVHLVPIRSADDLNFTRPKLKITQEELAEIANLIRNS